MPKSLLVEAVLARLRKLELPNDPAPAEQTNARYAISPFPSLRSSSICLRSCRLQRRVLCYSFAYEKDLDQRGILSWIATNGGKEKWKNPHLSGEVIVTASSVEVRQYCLLSVCGAGWRN